MKARYLVEWEEAGEKRSRAYWTRTEAAVAWKELATTKGVSDPRIVLNRPERKDLTPPPGRS